MSRQAYATINLSALKHNIRILKQQILPAKFMAVVKANAYGLGISLLSEALSDADALAVRSLPEAKQLRERGLTSPIVLLEGPFSFSELQYCVQHHCWPVLHSPQQIQWALQATGPLSVWLKVDLGMGRLGFEPSMMAEYYQRLKQSPSIHVLGILGHCPTADEAIDRFTVAMGQQIQALSQQWQCDYSLANSAVTLRYPEYHGQWARCGISLYGISPFENKVLWPEIGLQPVVSLNSQLMHIRTLPPKACVGYGCTWQTPASGARIGVVSIGYGDGYPQQMPSGAPVWIDNKIVPTVGRVNMDMLLVDLSDHPEIQVGAAVCLWGAQLPIETVAKAASSSPYELLTRLPAALPRLVSA